VGTDDFSLRQLRYFLVLGHELNYRRAAELLFVTQPAISSGIKQLERDLGVTLFLRDTRSVSLTDAGRMWLPKVEAALASLDNLGRDISEWARGRTGTLRIGYLVGIGTDLLTSILPKFEARYPDIRVEAIEFDFSDPSAGLRSGQVDVGIIRPPVDLDGFEVLDVDEESWVACLPRTHRFAHRTELRIEELLDEPIIAAPASAGGWRDYWLALDARGGKPANVTAVAATYESEFTAVSRGLGISFTTTGAEANYQRAGIVFVPIVGREPARVAVSWLSQNPSSQALRFITEMRPVTKPAAGQGRVPRPRS
jgi:DNA-binding transcriptional LysR family regulator